MTSWRSCEKALEPVKVPDVLLVPVSLVLAVDELLDPEEELFDPETVIGSRIVDSALFTVPMAICCAHQPLKRPGPEEGPARAAVHRQLCRPPAVKSF